MREGRPGLARLTAAAAILLAALGAARAELSIEKVQWQYAPPAKRAARVYEDVTELSAPPPSIAGRLRAKLTLKNRGPRPVEGILLRYSATARLADVKTNQAGTWAIPFMIEEKRVPRIGANQILEVPLGPSPLLDLYLRKIARPGFWPDQLKLQAMLEPHRGSVDKIAQTEAVLEIKR